MKNKLYKIMNWPKIEGIEYCDQNDPNTILGPHITKDGLVIQAYVPDAVKLSVKFASDSKKYEMEAMDGEGYFAVLIDKRAKSKYKLIAEYEDGATYEYWDPYQFECDIDETVLKKFNAGIAYDVYNVLGAHKKVIDGVSGVQFAVWAPFALRVSVVGKFNNWDGRKYQMSVIGDTGVFAIFVPEVAEGERYKFEIKRKGNENMLKADPFSFKYDVEDNSSVIVDVDSYKWSDSKWMNSRAKADNSTLPVSIYELHLGSWKKTDGKYDYTGIASYVKDMGYTHVQIMPVMQSDGIEAMGYNTQNFYAVDSNVGEADDIKKLVDELHKNNIGVILEWAPNHFASDVHGMTFYDGSCLYEHQNPLKGYDRKTGTHYFNYARPEVTNFLIANALFWTKVYHADGLCIHSVASMLYLDYDKKPGEWIPNIYGGNENLDAIEFLKHLNSIYRHMSEGAFIIADDNSGYPVLTGEVNEECIGFEYKWNYEWKNDVLGYMNTVPYRRSENYNDISNTLIYHYTDNFINGFAHNEFVNGKASLIGRMTGDNDESKFANLRLMYGFMYTHPGKKMMFMGQEFAQYEPWDINGELDWSLLKEDKHMQVQEYVKALNELYTNETALYELDSDENGFEWINNISARESVLVFARKGKKPEDMLIVVCNFDNVEREDYKIGVPSQGKYKEIFNSDSEKYGGNGFVNPRLKQSKTDECDGRPESIRINVPALGITVLKYSKTTETKKTAKPVAKTTAVNDTSVTEEKDTAKKATAKKTATKKTTAKKTTTKKTTAKKSSVAKTETKKSTATKTTKVSPTKAIDEEKKEMNKND